MLLAAWPPLMATRKPTPWSVALFRKGRNRIRCLLSIGRLVLRSRTVVKRRFTSTLFMKLGVAFGITMRFCRAPPRSCRVKSRNLSWTCCSTLRCTLVPDIGRRRRKETQLKEAQQKFVKPWKSAEFFSLPVKSRPSEAPQRGKRSPVDCRAGVQPTAQQRKLATGGGPKHGRVLDV